MSSMLFCVYSFQIDIGWNEYIVTDYNRSMVTIFQNHIYSLVKAAAHSDTAENMHSVNRSKTMWIGLIYICTMEHLVYSYKKKPELICFLGFLHGHKTHTIAHKPCCSISPLQHGPTAHTTYCSCISQQQRRLLWRRLLMSLAGVSVWSPVLSGGNFFLSNCFVKNESITAFLWEDSHFRWGKSSIIKGLEAQACWPCKKSKT